MIDDLLDELTESWGPAQQVAAQRRTYELAAELCGSLDRERLEALTGEVWEVCDTCLSWRSHLELCTGSFDAARLAREEHLVRLRARAARP